MLTLLLLVAALGVVDPAASAPAPVCSLVPVPSGRDRAATYVVGGALPDTVRAGPGPMRPRSFLGHWGLGRRRRVFGQVVRVEQLGGADSAALERAFTRLGTRDVIVVPWDYGADCSPVYWGGSYRWVGTSEPGFYTLRARPEADWVDGRPVLDALAAYLQPYPHGRFFAEGHRGTDAVRTGSALTPVEYFALYHVLPTYQELKEQSAEARQRLDRWERDHEALAAKYPATLILQYARDGLAR